MSVKNYCWDKAGEQGERVSACFAFLHIPLIIVGAEISGYTLALELDPQGKKFWL